MKTRNALLVLTALIFLVLGFAMYHTFYGPNIFPDGGTRTVYISRGQTFASIADSLEMRGAIRSRLLFVLVARLSGGTDRLHVGRYVFLSGVSNNEIYEAIKTGKGNQPIFVTIREGALARTQARIFSHQLGIDSAKYMALVRDSEFVRRLGLEGTSLEGYLLPETYSFNWEPDEQEVVRRQVAQFRTVFNDTLQQRAVELGWTIKEATTFASIIEGEAVLDEERPIISGVYHNRLQRGMKLEADPTIQYIVEGGPRRLLYSDLKLDSPYNTYLYAGLPPGPVNNPGKASILAALYPTRHDYLYFVANGRGGHWFSRTYGEHMKNVRRYRRDRAALNANAKGPTNS
jgi:UPF0755 protein